MYLRIHTALYDLCQQISSDRCELFPEGYKYVDHLQPDYQIELMSLPALIDLQLGDISGKPYLKPLPHTLSLPLDRQQINIGIVWTGNPENGNNLLRSVPLCDLMPLTNIPHTQLYSLQISEAKREIIDMGYQDKITDLSPYINDFVDTASIIEQLDIIICVDTVIAHLSGVFG